VIGQVSCPEQPVPEAEGDAEVAILRAVIGMDVMPGVEFGRVDEIVQRARLPRDIGVCKLSDRGAEDGAGK